MKNIKVSVIIPTGSNEKLENINRTVESVINSAYSEVEVLILADGWVPEGIHKGAIISPSSENLGERKTVNRGFKEATGDYVLRIDSHCAMSDNWDKILLSQYKVDTISLCVLDALDEETWILLGHNYTFVSVDHDCEERWWGNYPGLDKKRSMKELPMKPLTSLKELSIKSPRSFKCLLMEESMSLTGCGWFCSKRFFLDHLQFDEDLSKWGCIGPEITAKIEKANSSIILNKNVKCCHVFNTCASGYPMQEVFRTRELILSRYAKYIYRSAKRFNAPGWESITEDYISNYKKYLNCKKNVVKKENTETKDIEGNVIKTVVKIYEPIQYKGMENPDISELGKEITKDSKIKTIKIRTLVDEKWIYETIEDEQEIKNWLFEND